QGLLDGAIDMIATDHSPHTLEEKGCDINGKMTKSAIWDCISGFCGVETNVPLMLTQVNKGRMTLNHYVKVQSENVAKVWQMYPKKGAIRLGSDGDLTIAHMTKKTTQQEPSDAVGWLEDQRHAGLYYRQRQRADEGWRAGWWGDRPDADADYQLITIDEGGVLQQAIGRPIF